MVALGIIVLVCLGVVIACLIPQAYDWHPWRAHRAKKQVTIEFLRGPISQERILVPQSLIDSKEPIVLLVSREKNKGGGGILPKYIIPCATGERDWSAWCVVTYTYDLVWSYGIYRYTWLKTSTPEVTTCDRHVYHVTEGPLEMRKSQAPGGCSLEDPALGQVVSRPTPPLTLSTAGVPATLIPSPPIVPMAQRAEKVASIAQEMGLDTGTPKEKP